MSKRRIRRSARFVAALVLAVGGLGGIFASTASATTPGYVLAAADGGVFTFGRPFAGSMGGHRLNAPIKGVATTGDGKGYWLAAADGGVFTFGSARYFGSMGGTPLNQPVVGIASTSDGRGYWLVSSDGGVFAFGDARFFGSLSGAHVLAPVIGITSTGSGKGYWLLTTEGEAFSFGDATAPGGPPAIELSGEHFDFVGITPVAGTDRAFEAVTAPGQLFTTAAGSGTFSCGSQPALHGRAPIVGVAGAIGTCQSGWLAASDGGVFAIGRRFLGSMGGARLNAPVVGIAGS